ncbi:hypothetical protein RRG08_018440 [Elysia crispata]|uniref:Uncharacterized protein n=1 Tax=Elysia crispata TaxID=231223 RepID=A0AAE0YUH2_9GAST|nr:hypothetical protein RRG08_018440 [Elysia crispata]
MNLSRRCHPGLNRKVDEQLLPFRGRCAFIQYIPESPINMLSKYSGRVVLKPITPKQSSLVSYQHREKEVQTGWCSSSSTLEKYIVSSQKGSQNKMLKQNAWSPPSANTEFSCAQTFQSNTIGNEFYGISCTLLSMLGSY